jgi:gamma-glutamyltranspeptidase/glutathione hydrolase
MTAIPPYNPHAVTVPGAIDAWARLLADHGTKGFDELLQPAIRYAEQAFRSTAASARRAPGRRTAPARSQRGPHLSARGASAGRAKSSATPARSDAAQSGREGRVGFYRGAVAEDIVSYLRQLGAPHSLDDLANNKPDYVTPIGAAYRGLDIYQIPPNNQGITALIMLNILSGFDLGKLAPLSAERLHLEIEAGRLAFRDRNAFIADMAKAEVPVDALLSAAYAAEQRKYIDPRRAMTDLPPSSLSKSETVYFCVVDRDRNAVSFINSVYHGFGSGIVTPNTGIAAEPRHQLPRRSRPSQRIAPGKRPLHTIMPGMAMKGDRAVMPYGVMGGDYQPFGHTHFLTNVLDFGCDLQEALDLARVFYAGNAVQVERGVPQEAAFGLTARGHRVELSPEPFGGGHAIWIDWQSGVLTGGSEPRMDGGAMGF